MKVIFHLDLDSYFVSAERSVNPFLNNKPVVISSGKRRSIISAASYEAKKHGVYIPMPFYKAQALIPDLISVEPNFSLYTVLSSKLFEYISSKYTKNIEVASIDECYIDVTDIWEKYGSPAKLARDMQDNIFKDLKLPCSIGVSNNKFVAKMSTQINKPKGITITKQEDFLKVFGDWKVNEFHGIGFPSANKFATIGIKTIKDLAMAPLELVETQFKSLGKELIWKANGNGPDELDYTHNELKSIGNSITFQDKDRSNRQEILEILSSLCKTVALRATNRCLVGSVISVKIKNKGGLEAKNYIKQITLPKPINTFEEIFFEATKVFDMIWEEQVIKFIGITLSKLTNQFETSYQTSIFDKEKEVSKAQDIINQVNKKFKMNILKTGEEVRLNKIKKQNQSRYIESDRIIKHFDDDYK